jgi:hypothetical protein
MNKKENKILLIYKEIQMGAVAKSYMRKGFLIYEEAVSYTYKTLQQLPSEFPYKLGIFFFFFISVVRGQVQSPVGTNIHKQGKTGVFCFILF